MRTDRSGPPVSSLASAASFTFADCRPFAGTPHLFLMDQLSDSLNLGD